MNVQRVYGLLLIVFVLLLECAFSARAFFAQSRLTLMSKGAESYATITNLSRCQEHKLTAKDFAETIQVVVNGRMKKLVINRSMCRDLRLGDRISVRVLDDQDAVVLATGGNRAEEWLAILVWALWSVFTLRLLMKIPRAGLSRLFIVIPAFLAALSCHGQMEQRIKMNWEFPPGLEIVEGAKDSSRLVLSNGADF